MYQQENNINEKVVWNPPSDIPSNTRKQRLNTCWAG